MFYAEMAISSFCIWAPDLGYSKLDISFRSLMSIRFDNNDAALQLAPGFSFCMF